MIFEFSTGFFRNSGHGLKFSHDIQQKTCEIGNLMVQPLFCLDDEENVIAAKKVFNALS